MEFFDNLDNNNDCLKYDSEKSYERYLDLVTNMKVREYNEPIYNVLSRINQVENYDEKKNLQKQAYLSMLEKSDELIAFFEDSKKYYLSVYSLDKYFSDVFGINKDTLDVIEEKIRSKYNKLFKYTNSIILGISTENMMMDYLFSNNDEIGIIGDIEDASSIIISSLNNNIENPFMIESVIKMFRNGYIKVIEKEKQNNINKTFYFPNIKTNKIIVNYDGSMESFLTLCHEIGHSYFNVYYGESFFDDSRQIINESLAYLFELICIDSILQNKELDDSIKKDLFIQYVSRINKILLSEYSVHILEKELIKIIMDNDGLKLCDFLNVQSELDNHILVKGIEFKNQKFTHMNALLNSSFIFGFYEHLKDPVAYVIAVSLFSK